MREIKFRAWDKETKFMVDPVVYDDTSFTESGLQCLSDSIRRAQENYILMQFTGLKDKNGKEIYEGDIVRWGNNKALEISFGWGDDAEAYGESFGILIGSSVFCGAHKDCEVIGNIYENPELLKEEHGR